MEYSIHIQLIVDRYTIKKFGAIKKHQATLDPSAIKHSSSLKGCNPTAKVAQPESLLPLSPVSGCEDRKLQKYLAT